MTIKATYEELENRVRELMAACDQAKAALKENKAQDWTLIHKIQAAVVVHGADTQISECNPKAQELLGLSKDQILGRKAVHPDWHFLSTDGNKMRIAQYPVNQVLADRQPLVDLELGIFRPDKNDIVWVLVNASPDLDDKGEIKQVIITFMEITERKQAEKRLLQSENALRATLDATPFPVAVVDLKDDKINFWSRSALELFGHTAPTAAEWYQKAYPEPDYQREVLDRWKPILEKARESGKPVNAGEYRITCKDGTERICELYATFLPNDLIVTFNDITARRKAEASLKSIEWQLNRPARETIYPPQPYGDLTTLNTERVILSSIGADVLSNIVSGYLTLLETSAAVYERNGDYAHGIFSSRWCRMMDSASRALCKTSDDAEALACGKWLCHESCWTDASKVAIQSSKPVDIECNGGLRLYAVPIEANGDIVGCINFGYGDPPKNTARLKALAQKYSIDMTDLAEEANRYESRSPFIIEIAKRQLRSSAKLIGALVESKRSQDALDKEREQLNVTLRSIGDGVITTDTAGNVVLLNKMAETLTGWKQKDARGQPLEKVFHIINEQTRQRCESPVNKVLTTDGIVGFANRTVLIARDGSERIIADSGSPIVDNVGKTVGVVLVFRDNTEKIELESKLRQAHKMEAVGTLAGGIAHEFNNVLGIIIGNTELAVDDLESWHPVSENLREIKIASLRAKDVVKQLLSFSRSDQIRQKPIDIRIIVKESLKLLRATIPSSILIHANISQDIDTVVADPTQIHQLLINLCNNAAQAMAEEGGTITIDLKNIVINPKEAMKHPDLLPKAYVKLSVRDDGYGIPPNDSQKIFEPYFTTKAIGKGTGMGLAVVHGIVKTHDGAIHVDSIVGQGTVFHIYIPSSSEAAHRTAKRQSVLPTGTEKILFIDDEPSITKLFVSALSKLGYTVSSETNPVNALNQFQANPNIFDLVITDMTMPNITGDRLAKALIKLRNDIPIIICTGHSSKISPEKADQLGIKTLLMKPVATADLAHAVRKVLDASNRTVQK